MPGLLFDALHAGLGRALDLRQQQHALTASNIANADTPGYEAAFVPFDRVLAQAVDGGGGVALQPTHPLHLGAGELDAAGAPVERIEAPPWSVDGNSVDVEREMVRLTENALMFDAVAQGTSQRLAMLRYVANDGRG